MNVLILVLTTTGIEKNQDLPAHHYIQENFCIYSYLYTYLIPFLYDVFLNSITFKKNYFQKFYRLRNISIVPCSIRDTHFSVMTLTTTYLGDVQVSNYRVTFFRVKFLLAFRNEVVAKT